MHIVLHHQDIYINHIQHLILNSMHFTFSAQVRSWHLEAQWVELDRSGAWWQEKSLWRFAQRLLWKRRWFVFESSLETSCTMFSQQRFAYQPIAEQKHTSFQPLLHSEPDHWLQGSCVDPQTSVDNCVECSIVSYLVQQDEAVLWDWPSWSSFSCIEPWDVVPDHLWKVALLRGFTTQTQVHPNIFSKYKYHQFQIYVNDMKAMQSAPSAETWKLNPSTKHATWFQQGGQSSWWSAVFRPCSFQWLEITNGQGPGQGKCALMVRSVGSEWNSKTKPQKIVGVKKCWKGESRLSLKAKLLWGEILL